MRLSTRLELQNLQQIMTRRGLETKGKVQQFIDSEVLRLCDSLTPLDTGKLKQSGITGTRIGSGKVVYNAPYSKYQYYGKVMVGNAPKTVTDRDLQYHSGDSKRGSFWFERMKTAHKNDILKGARRIANRG